MRAQDWAKVGGRANVGMADAEMIEPIWTDEQIGFVDGTAPKTLKKGERRFVDERAVNVTREKFNDLLGPYVEAPVTGVKQVQAGLDIPVAPPAPLQHAAAPVVVSA